MFRYPSLPESIFFSILSGCLTHLAFPAADLSILAFFALIPYLLSIWNASLKKTFAMSFIYAFTFHGLQMEWITYFHWSAYPGLLVTLGVFYGTTGVCFRFLSRRVPFLKPLLLPMAFTSFEYLRTIGFIKFSYGNLGYALSGIPDYIQIAEITGHLGLSFILYLNNGLITDLIQDKKKWATFKNPLSWVLNRIVLLLLVHTLIFTYGVVRKEHATQSSKKSIKVALIQPWHDFNEPWSSQTRSKLFMKLTRQSDKAALYQPDLIIWPESALFTYYENYLQTGNAQAFMYKNYFQNFMRNHPNTQFLVGSMSYKNTPSTDGSKEKPEIYNTILQLHPDASVKANYSKRLLVPFAEWFPYEEYFPFLKPILAAAEASQFTPGKKMTVFEQGEYRYSALICYEDVFGDFTRRFAKLGAHFLVVVTNDAWSYTPVSEVLHNSLSIFRAIETRRPILRATNAGVTCLISSDGRIKHSLPLFEENILCVEFQPQENITPYARYGNTPFMILTLLVLLSIAVSFFRKPVEKSIKL